MFSLALERYLQGSDAPCDVTRGKFNKLQIFSTKKDGLLLLLNDSLETNIIVLKHW